MCDNIELILTWIQKNDYNISNNRVEASCNKKRNIMKQYSATLASIKPVRLLSSNHQYSIYALGGSLEFEQVKRLDFSVGNLVVAAGELAPEDARVELQRRRGP